MIDDVADAGSPTRVWRVRRASRAGVLLYCAAMVAALAVEVTALSPDGEESGVIAFWLLATISCLGAWRFAFHPRIVLRDGLLSIVNPLSTHVMPVHEVVAASAGYYGIRIRRRDHRTCIAWAIQKTNAASWTHRTTRADDVAASIMSAATRHA